MKDKYVEIAGKNFLYTDSGWYKDKGNNIDYYRYNLKNNPVAIIFDSFVDLHGFENNVCLVLSKELKLKPYKSSFLNILCGINTYRVNENNIKRIYNRLDK